MMCLETHQHPPPPRAYHNCIRSKGEPGWQPVEAVDPERFRRLYAINVEGVLNTVAAVSPGMKAACAGKIVNVSSGAGLKPSLTGIQGYTAAKHAQVGLSATVCGHAVFAAKCVSAGNLLVLLTIILYLLHFE
jgi:NAD(P)-dependent dehydrogenase (short-subunit alcohol dehydrogenase family)